MPEHSEILDLVQPTETLRVDGGANLQPTLYIGLGGFGCFVISELKRQIAKLPSEVVGGFGFLGMDTHPWDSSSVLSQTEYIPIGVGVSPHDRAKGDSAHLGWFENVMHGFPARNVMDGADTLKPVGRLAFHISVESLVTRLTEFDNRLRTFREKFRSGLNAKVYVISTMAGGTGAGCVIDAMAVIGKFFRTRAGAQFPYQAILVAPDVLEGTVAAVSMPPLYANCYATLKEFHHLYHTSTPEVVSYNSAILRGIEVNQDNLPSAIHLLTNRNENGTVICKELQQLGQIVVEYLLSEVRTPLPTGEHVTPRIQDLENQQRDSLGQGGVPRSFSSFGVATAGVPVEWVGRYYLSKLIVAALQNELAESTGITDLVNNWIKSHKLSESASDDLQDLVKEKILNDLRISTDARSVVLADFKYEELENRASAYRAECRRSCEEQCKIMIDQESTQIATAQSKAIVDEFNRRLEQESLGNALAFMRRLQDGIKLHQKSLSEESNAALKNLTEELEKGVDESIHHFAKLTEGFFGRKDRVREGVDEFQIRLDAALNATNDVWVKRGAASVYDALLQTTGMLLARWEGRKNQLQSHLAYLTGIRNEAGLRIDRLSRLDKREGSRFSVVNQNQSNQLYIETIGAGLDGIIQSVHNGWMSGGFLEEPGENSERWWRLGSEKAYVDHVRPVLASFTFNNVVERFYPTDAQRKNLMAHVSTLSMPLFDLDPTLGEPSYLSYGIFAVPEAERPGFERYRELMNLDGKTWSLSDNAQEVTIYQLRFGYTISSFRPLRRYEQQYSVLEQQYMESFHSDAPKRPIHCWEGADEWEELVGKQEADAALVTFALGRAFDRIAGNGAGQAGGAKQKSEFIYQDMGVYKINQDDFTDAPWILGSDRRTAVSVLEEHPQWQDTLKARIKKRSESVGEEKFRSELTAYITDLRNQLAQMGSGNQSPDARILRRTALSLEKYLQQISPSAF
jgi:hypothetical protein